MKDHPALTRLREATIGSPYEGRLWLVGGAVRDDLLGSGATPDFDVTLEGDAVELASFLRGRGASEIEPVVYPRFGTALVRIADTPIELAGARRESYEPDSRKPDVAQATLEEDAKRRDFTVNAILRNLHTWELWDPLARGLDDLEARLLRTPRDPVETFHDDPLRMLRAVRFRGQLRFSYAEGLEQAIAAEAHRLSVISAERIRDEIAKMLMLPDASACFRDLLRLGLLARFAPELGAMAGVEQGRYHHLDVWDHTLLVLDELGPADLPIRLAALLHDVAKPATRTIDAQGQTRFFGHEAVGAQMAQAFLERLRFPSEVAAVVAKLVKNHMRLGSAPTFTPAAARRLIRDLGEDLDALFALVEADARALRPGVKTMDLDAIRAQVAEALRKTPAATLESPLDGQAIMEALGIAPGEEVGRAKSWLLDQVLEGHIAPGDRQGALRALAGYRPGGATRPTPRQ